MLEVKTKDQGHNVLTPVFSKKKVFLNLPRGLWRVPQDKEKKGHDLGPFFTNQKIVLPRPRTGNFRRLVGLGLRDGGSGGTSYPGPGLGGAGLKGLGRAQVSALSFGIAP